MDKTFLALLSAVLTEATYDNIDPYNPAQVAEWLRKDEDYHPKLVAYIRNFLQTHLGKVDGFLNLTSSLNIKPKLYQNRLCWECRNDKKPPPLRRYTEMSWGQGIQRGGDGPELVTLPGIPNSDTWLPGYGPATVGPAGEPVLPPNVNSTGTKKTRNTVHVGDVGIIHNSEYRKENGKRVEIVELLSPTEFRARSIEPGEILIPVPALGEFGIDTNTMPERLIGKRIKLTKDIDLSYLNPHHRPFWEDRPFVTSATLPTKNTTFLVKSFMRQSHISSPQGKISVPGYLVLTNPNLKQYNFHILNPSTFFSSNR